MSTVAEVKTATEQLSVLERWGLQRWLGESGEVRRLRCEELRRDIAIRRSPRAATIPRHCRCPVA